MIARSSAVASIAVALLCALGACGGGDDVRASLETPPWQLDGPREATSRKRNFHVAWAPVPDPPPFNEYFELEFTVSALGTKALVGDDAQVAVTLRMPQHGHGLVTTPEMSRRDDGVFVLTGVLLHMQGEWVMRVRVVADEVIDEASFVLNLH